MLFKKPKPFTAPRPMISSLPFPIVPRPASPIAPRPPSAIRFKPKIPIGDEGDDEKEKIKKLQEQIKAIREQTKKPTLQLTKTDKEGLLVGTLKDGRKYSVRENRDKFFFPDDWLKFYDTLKDFQKLTFEVLINTGARHKEARNIKVGDIDFDRGNIVLRITKGKKGEKYLKPRTISISSKFSRRLNVYIRKNKLNNEDYLGILSRPASHICMKKTLQKADFKDWYMYALHNIRKTHGNYLKSLGVDSGEICIRLGHNMGIFLKHYASPDIFSREDLKTMRVILGDIYQK